MIDVSNEYTFSVKAEGEKTKRSFEGSFTVKCLLTMNELRELGLRLDALNNGSKTLPPTIILLNRSLAELDVRIIKSPSWWKDSDSGRELFDQNIIYEIFNKAVDAESVYQERLVEHAKQADEAIEKQAKKKVAKE